MAHLQWLSSLPTARWKLLREGFLRGVGRSAMDNQQTKRREAGPYRTGLDRCRSGVDPCRAGCGPCSEEPGAGPCIWESALAFRKPSLRMGSCVLAASGKNITGALRQAVRRDLKKRQPRTSLPGGVPGLAPRPRTRLCSRAKRRGGLSSTSQMILTSLSSSSRFSSSRPHHAMARIRTCPRPCPCPCHLHAHHLHVHGADLVSPRLFIYF